MAGCRAPVDRLVIHRYYRHYYRHRALGHTRIDPVVRSASESPRIRAHRPPVHVCEVAAVEPIDAISVSAARSQYCCCWLALATTYRLFDKLISCSLGTKLHRGNDSIIVAITLLQGRH